MKVSSPKPDLAKPVSQRTSNIVGQAIVSGALSNVAGSVQTGIKFHVSVSCNCLGGRFYWSSAGSAKTVKLSLWSEGGSRLANVSVSVNASGVYEATFSSPVALTQGTYYRISTWETGAGSYTKATLSSFNTVSPTRPQVCGGGAYVLFEVTRYGSGDVFPNSTATTEAYPVEPLLDV